MCHPARTHFLKKLHTAKNPRYPLGRLTQRATHHRPDQQRDVSRKRVKRKRARLIRLVAHLGKERAHNDGAAAACAGKSAPEEHLVERLAEAEHGCGESCAVERDDEAGFAAESVAGKSPRDHEKGRDEGEGAIAACQHEQAGRVKWKKAREGSTHLSTQPTR